jgi:DNA-binding SARP family transcriptional activator/tetratricopeptide (TPR) repeat protein
MGSRPVFRLLGPLEALVADRVVPVRAGRHRALLTSLALRPGEVVPVEELVEHVWGESPPERTRGAVQTYVMRLRQLLGDASLIRTTPLGYVLDVDPRAVDVSLFLAHARRGDELVAAGEAVAARAEFAAAVTLWRGPALSDVPSESLHRDVVPGLVERLLLVHEERLDVELALGGHGELVPVLLGLTRDHPLRERFWGQLMTALYRCSRQGEALEVFRRATRVLHEQLGVEPGEPLRRLHRAILVGAPELAAPERARVVPAREEAPGGVLRLPADVPRFVGRERAVARVVELIAPRETGTAVPVVTLSGPPGIGKTALAVRVAHLLASRFPDGQLYVDLRGDALGPPLAPVDVLSRFLRALGVPAEGIPLEQDEMESVLRSLLSGRRMLLVLDNAVAPDQVRPLLPGDPGCPVIVTSREDLRGLIATNGARPVPLSALDPREALELLTALLGEAAVRAEPVATAELAVSCGHRPLELSVAAATVLRRGVPIARHVAELRGTDPLVLAHAALGPAEQRMLRLLSVVPGPEFSAHAAANVADVDVAEAAKLLGELAEAHLLLEWSPGRYRFHDRLAVFAARECADRETPAERAEARARLLDFSVRAVDRCATVLYPDLPRLPVTGDSRARLPRIDGPAAAMRWLDAELVNLTAAIRHAAEHGPAAMSWRLADALRGYLWIGEHVTEWLTAAHHGLNAAHEERHRPAEAAMHQNLGALHWRVGDFPAAVEHYDTSVRMLRALGDAKAEASALNSLGLVSLEAGDLPSARKHLRASLGIARRSGVLANLGLLAMESGDLAGAVEHLSEALRRSTADGSPTAEAACRTFLAVALLLRGEPDEAWAHLERALATGGGARALVSMAAVRLSTGMPAAALELAREAWARVGENAEPQIAARVLMTLAEAHRGLGELVVAEERCWQALDTARRLGHLGAEVRATVELAAIRRLRGCPGEALTLSEQALEPALRVGLRVVEGVARSERAAALLALGDHAAAAEEAARALAVQRATGHRPGEEKTRHLLAQLERDHGSPARTPRADRSGTTS